MSRWLWALLAGVVLVAIAAVFWIDQTSVLPPVSRGTTPVAPAPSPASTAQNAAPSAPVLTFAPGRAGGGSPARSGSGARCRTASHLAARSDRAVPRKARGSPGRRAGAFAPACSGCARRSAAAATRARTGGAGSRGHICAQEPCAAGWDLGLFRGGLRAALPAARRRLGLSAAGGQVRPGRDCRVAEENPSPFRHLPDRGRILSGRHAQGKRRLRGLD